MSLQPQRHLAQYKAVIIIHIIQEKQRKISTNTFTYVKQLNTDNTNHERKVTTTTTKKEKRDAIKIPMTD